MSEISQPQKRDESSNQRSRLAAALRKTVSLAMVTEASDATIEQAIKALEEINARFAEKQKTERPFDAASFFSPFGEFRTTTSPITGIANPLAPPVFIEYVDGPVGCPREVLGHVYFDYAYEGVPNCLHGGFVAQILDEILGAANQAAGTVGMTGTMTVRYRQPTPTHRKLTLRSRLVKREGRKLFDWAGIYDGEILTAEAEGTFIEVLPEQFEAIAAK